LVNNNLKHKVIDRCQHEQEVFFERGNSKKKYTMKKATEFQEEVAVGDYSKKRFE
jgi:hypothetical protein